MTSINGRIRHYASTAYSTRHVFERLTLPLNSVYSSITDHFTQLRRPQTVRSSITKPTDRRSKRLLPVEINSRSAVYCGISGAQISADRIPFKVLYYYTTLFYVVYIARRIKRRDQLQIIRKRVV